MRAAAGVPGSAIRGCCIVLVLLMLATASSAGARPAASRGVLPPPSFRPAVGWSTMTTGPTNTREFAPEVKAASDHGGATPVFTKARWPLHLSSFRVDHGWEGQPAANVQQRLHWAVVDGWHLDVRVYFGTQHPSKALLTKTRAELDRLRLPR